MRSFPFLALNNGSADNSTIVAKIAQCKKSLIMEVILKRMILVESKCNKNAKKRHKNTWWIWSGKMEIKSIKNNQTSSISWPPLSPLSSFSYPIAVQDTGCLKLQKIEFFQHNFFRTLSFLKSAIPTHLKSRVLFCTWEWTILAWKAQQYLSFYTSLRLSLQLQL